MIEPLLRFVEIASAFAAGIGVGVYATRRSKKAAGADNASAANPSEGNAEPITQVPEAPVPQPRPVTELGRHLFTSLDPAFELAAWTSGVRRLAEQGGTEAPSVLELFCARQLEEAGVCDEDYSLSGLKVVRPHTNGMFYLRLTSKEQTFGETLSMLRTEAALNAGVLAEELFLSHPPADEEEIYAALSTLMQRITVQGQRISRLSLEGDGEWAARMSLSNALESLRLPFRLLTRFRMNLAAGEVAIEFEVTPAEVFARSALVDGVGIIPTTEDMRTRAQTDYTMRLAVLVAECAFASSEHISRAWVAANERTPESHACLLSASFTREHIEDFDQDPIADVESLLAQSGASISIENGKLVPCSQSFSLNEERFCPPFRYETVGLSSRSLDPEEAKALGTSLVRGLEIDESARREQLAENVAMRIPADGESSCEQAVRAVLELSAETDDETLRSAAVRTAQRLVEGTLDPDPLAVLDALCDDNGLVEAVSSAQEALIAGEHERAEEIMARALAPYDATDAYTDSPTDEWRAFSSYVDRVLYNLKFSREGVATHLVPEAYVEALITRSMALLAVGRGDEALALARRTSAICPTGAVVRLHLIQCLGFLGHAEEERQQLVMLLSQAHDPEGLGFGYYRMALILLQEGKVAAARAAYQRAMSFMPTGASEALQGMGIFFAGAGMLGTGELSTREMERALTAEGVPFAPTEEVTQAFMNAARAAVDAEVFPVARDFMRVLGSISRDDVLFGMLRSLEDEPDR